MWHAQMRRRCTAPRQLAPCTMPGTPSLIRRQQSPLKTMQRQLLRSQQVKLREALLNPPRLHLPSWI